MQLQLNGSLGFLSYDVVSVLRSFMVSTIATCSPVIVAKLVETKAGCRKGFISMLFSNFIYVTVTSYHFVPQIFPYFLFVHFFQLDLSILFECKVILKNIIEDQSLLFVKDCQGLSRKCIHASETQCG